MKKAFTMSEMLVCLAIISVIASILISSIAARPNSNMVMFRKAYNITSNAVYEMINNTAYYSNGDLSEESATADPISDGVTKPSGTAKFCKIFADYLNIAGDIPACDANDNVKNKFNTLDGMTWVMPVTTFNDNNTLTHRIMIDVNGDNNPPNCVETEEGCNKPDRFFITVNKNGKLSVTGVALDYLQNSKNISR